MNDNKAAEIIAESLNRVARELSLLGNAGAVSENGATMGAIECLSMQLRDGAERIADAISDGLHAIANAVADSQEDYSDYTES